MSHPEQLGFFDLVARTNTPLIAGARVLEIGSYDVNGTIRGSFASASEYVGVDLTPGPGVDVVSYGHELDHPDESFDITLSGECFEHDPHWLRTFDNMVRLTRPGGLVAVSCASSGRPEHGTTRALIDNSPGTQAVGIDYYRNLDETDFLADLPVAEMFSSYGFWYLPSAFDLYFAGVRTGAPPQDGVAAVLPIDSEVAGLRSLTSLPHRVARAPLRVARRVVSDDERYQRVILPYWLTLLRLQARVTRRG